MILIITNDIGYMIYGDANIHRLGYAIPINSQYILGIIPNLARPYAYSANKEWFPIINYVRLDHNNHQSYNERMCQFAARFIYCGSFETINKYPKAEKVKKIPLPEPAEIGFDQGQIAMAADMDWFKLLSLLSSDPDNEENWRHFRYEQYNDLSGDLLTDKDFVKLPGGFLRMGNVVYINLLGYSRSMC